MSDFGDFEPDDAFDLEPPDPEQVARKYQRLRHRHLGGPDWDDLDPSERERLLVLFVELVEWLRRQGAIR